MKLEINHRKKNRARTNTWRLNNWEADPTPDSAVTATVQR